jgi:ABC-type transporter Mla MlaB component
MLKIATQDNPPGGATLSLAGAMRYDSLGQIERELEGLLRREKEVVIDLSEVTLIDRSSLCFLAAQGNRNIRLVNCPEYIQPWMVKGLLK